ncbi:5-formyltetrahydrofolate cyclo-ligase [Thioclava sp. JE_KL1]|uniref:5-formyltetrahydrofolate cyclo-ligase n=1 Tax=Thioclava sp. JE_KL1 TaxID=2651187 RepID=UPI00128DC738|nr:5-formyltetrahydrofolate cyclo-ligase [Thioclava sp. JE_KL1]MPQ92336.1 5-formyltetrahydrofolate cyclo-ligase [Thioclava sp. JE_KL1]
MSKDLARKDAFAARKAAHAADDGAATRALTAALEPFAGKVLAGYWPIRTEPDPRPAMVAHGGPLCLPVVVAEAQPLVFHRWTPETEMIAGAFGAHIPAEGEEVTPEVLIVPLLAFDAKGYRLGYGGGFYDRTLEGLRARGPVTAIGFAFAAQEVPEVPTEPTDQPLDMIVTEAGILHL